jgi:glyoxylase-like metal-dependent hydrolase (beta-lactamase superfamily II)
MKRRIFSAVFIFIGLLVLALTIYIKSSDNINTIELPKEVIVLKFEFTNVFLVPIKDGYVLIDNAYEKEYDLFLDYLRDKNISIKDIKYILLTHHHDDHVGFLNQIVAENKNVRIVLAKETAKLLRKGKNNLENGGGIVNSTIYTLFRIKQILTPSWNLTFPPYVIRENDIVIVKDYFDLSGILGIDLVAIHTPGHSSDSTTFIYNEKIAFCGDLASNFLNWAGAKYLTLFNEDINIVYESWKKLIDIKIVTIATAHGKSFHIKNLENSIFKNSQSNIVKLF